MECKKQQSESLRYNSLYITLLHVAYTALYRPHCVFVARITIASTALTKARATARLWLSHMTHEPR